MKEVAHLVARIAELERRVASMIRHGTVEEVDAKKHRVRLRIGEDDQGQPFLGPWVPYAQVAGALKVHTPPSKGQQLTLFSPGGDFRQALAVPLTWSEQNASPSEKGDEHILTFANVKIEVRDGQTKLTVGDAVIDTKKDSITVTLGGNGFTLDKDKLQMTQKFVGKGGSRPAAFKGGMDGQGEPIEEGNDDILV
jgi:phage baseplate assembly protein V